MTKTILLGIMLIFSLEGIAKPKLCNWAEYQNPIEEIFKGHIKMRGQLPGPKLYPVPSSIMKFAASALKISQDIPFELRISALQAACLTGNLHFMQELLNDWQQRLSESEFVEAISQNSRLVLNETTYLHLSAIEFALLSRRKSINPAVSFPAEMVSQLLKKGAIPGVRPNHPFPFALRPVHLSYAKASSYIAFDADFPFYATTPTLIAAHRRDKQALELLVSHPQFGSQIPYSFFYERKTDITWAVKASHLAALHGPAAMLQTMIEANPSGWPFSNRREFEKFDLLPNDPRIINFRSEMEWTQPNANIPAFSVLLEHLQKGAKRPPRLQFSYQRTIQNLVNNGRILAMKDIINELELTKDDETQKNIAELSQEEFKFWLHENHLTGINIKKICYKIIPGVKFLLEEMLERTKSPEFIAMSGASAMEKYRFDLIQSLTLLDKQFDTTTIQFQGLRRDALIYVLKQFDALILQNHPELEVINFYLYWLIPEEKPIASEDGSYHGLKNRMKAIYFGLVPRRSAAKTCADSFSRWLHQEIFVHSKQVSAYGALLGLYMLAAIEDRERQPEGRYLRTLPDLGEIIIQLVENPRPQDRMSALFDQPLHDGDAQMLLEKLKTILATADQKISFAQLLNEFKEVTSLDPTEIRVEELLSQNPEQMSLETLSDDVPEERYIKKMLIQIFHDHPTLGIRHAREVLDAYFEQKKSSIVLNAAHSRARKDFMLECFATELQHHLTAQSDDSDSLDKEEPYAAACSKKSKVDKMLMEELDKPHMARIASFILALRYWSGRHMHKYVLSSNLAFAWDEYNPFKR